LDTPRFGHDGNDDAPKNRNDSAHFYLPLCFNFGHGVSMNVKADAAR